MLIRDIINETMSGAIATVAVPMNSDKIIKRPGPIVKKKKKKVSERPLSNKEKSKKEKYVKGMKKSKGDFEKRYGKDAKAVMYATATKLAKKD